MQAIVCFQGGKSQDAHSGGARRSGAERKWQDWRAGRWHSLNPGYPDSVGGGDISYNTADLKEAFLSPFCLYLVSSGISEDVKIF